MKKKPFSKEQILGVLKAAEAGTPIKEFCRKHGFSDAPFYLWRKKYGGMSVSEAKRLHELEAENTKLKRLTAESMLNTHALRTALSRKLLAARDPAPALENLAPCLLLYCNLRNALADLRASIHNGSSRAGRTRRPRSRALRPIPRRCAHRRACAAARAGCATHRRAGAG
jgi:putative transposase